MKHVSRLMIGVVVAASASFAVVTSAGSPAVTSRPAASVAVNGSTVTLDGVGVSFDGPGWTAGIQPGAPATSGIVHVENGVVSGHGARLVVYVADGAVSDPGGLTAAYAAEVHAALTAPVTSGQVVRANFILPGGWYGSVLWIALLGGRYARVEVRTTDRELTLRVADRIAATLTVNAAGR